MVKAQILTQWSEDRYDRYEIGYSGYGFEDEDRKKEALDMFEHDWGKLNPLHGGIVYYFAQDKWLTPYSSEGAPSYHNVQCYYGEHYQSRVCDCNWAKGSKQIFLNQLGSALERWQSDSGCGTG